MELLELCKKIKLQEELLQKMVAVLPELDFHELQPEISGLTEKERSQQAYETLRDRFEADKENLRILACYLTAACKVWDTYKSMGIPEEVFIATMKCFTRSADEYKIRAGSYRFVSANWVHNHTNMSIFRIGELEYELGEYPRKGYAMSGDYLKPQKVIALHIPTDADLRGENMEQSFAAGRKFIKEFFPEYADALMVCESWLLSPELGKMLKETSNIKRFQSYFTIFHTRPDALDCIRWLFQTDNTTPFSELKEETSLQRAVKKHLLAGGQIGAAYGVCNEGKNCKERSRK